jgi:predicted metal-dependent phosphoesterase TrpH
MSVRMMRQGAEAPAGMADLHIHTHHSDGQDSPGEVLEWAGRIGLDVIAITDHDSIDGARIAAEMARQNGAGPEVIVGEEVSSRDGHILALYIDDLVPPGMSADDTVAAIHAQHGLAVAAHPYWRTNSFDHAGRMYGLGDLIAEVDFDAIEVVNGGFTPSMIGANRRAGWVAEALGRTAVGGSDAHVKHALAWGHTKFAGRSATDLRKAIREGRTQAGRSRLHPTGIRRYAAWSISRLRLAGAV